MIGKAKSIAHVSNAVDYAKNKKGAIEISRHNVAGETGTEIAKEFRVFQNLNARCEKNSFSIVLSPAIPDGDKLTNGDFARLADDFLSRINLKENQYITFLHSDRNHKHLHIFVNRIDFNGKAYKDNYISKKAQRLAESIAKDWKFTTAKEVQQQKEERFRRQVVSAHEKVLTQNPLNIFEYAELMKGHDIQMHLKQARDGKVVGIRFQIGEESVKASSLHRAFSAGNLQKLIVQNQRTIEQEKRQRSRPTKKRGFRL